jgi:hypothetical protein
MSDKTVVAFLLDRTGSMEHIRDDTIGAFNAYLQALQEGDEDITFSLLLFDSVSIDKICTNVPVKDVERLSRETYVPRAWTPLIDAAYKTIKAVEAYVEGKGDKVVICIQTDGDENSSTEYTWQDLNDLIKEKTAAGWQFNFMGAGLDAYKQGQRMGISVGQTMSYDHSDLAATRAAFVSNARNTSRYASGMSANTVYSAEQKQRAGDRFDPNLAKGDAPQKQDSKRSVADDITL